MRLLSRHARASRDERGQALVEFALIAPLFLMLVIGVIQFAVALNFWFDLQRLANQGARSAAVNCGQVNGTTQCGPTTLAKFLGPVSSTTPEGQVISAGNHLFGGNDSSAPASQWGGYDSAEICYVVPAGSTQGSYTAQKGDAVRVTLKDKYRLQAIANLAKIDLVARATMMLEQDPTSSALPDPANSVNWVLSTHTGNAPCQP